jgi:hypothetical protein
MNIDSKRLRVLKDRRQTSPKFFHSSHLELHRDLDKAGTNASQAPQYVLP